MDSSGQPAGSRRPFRDRRGRGLRGPTAWPPVPAMTSRREQFDALVVEVAERARPWLGSRHADVEFAVEDVPSESPLAWEPQIAVLGRIIGAHGDRRIVLYRRPIEARGGSHAELAFLVREVVAEQVALVLGVPPDEITL